MTNAICGVRSWEKGNINLADIALQTAPPPPVGPVVGGERYGRYHLLERIGKGGMAEIFRAVSGGAEGWSRMFVIKRIRPEKSGSTEFIRMFCEEARLCAMLHHPNIVQVYDFGQIGGSYFLAMEYLQGKDLSSVMRALRAIAASVPASVAAFIGQQAAAGLHHAHTLVDGAGQPVRIVHRDVTPSNIMLLRTGGVKILDFGIAKEVGQGEPVETDAGQVKGKLAYLSPEQVRCLPLDGRADIFALGVVLWEMLTGQRLFSADSEFQTMRNVLMMPIPVPSTLRPGIPPALDAVVARALERDRDARYPNAQAMAADLEQVVHNERVSARAIPQLLERLFGEDTSGLTFPPAELQFGDEASIPAPRAPSNSSERGIPLGLDGPGAGGEVSMQIVAEPTPPPPVVVSGWRARLTRRNAVVAAAAATLAVCFSWAALKRNSRPESPPITSAVATAPVATPPAPAPVAAVAAIPSSPSSPMAPVARPTHARAGAPAPRAKASHRRPTRALATDLTIDPFR